MVPSEIPTVAGTLRIKTDREACAYQLTLEHRTVLKTNCEDPSDPNANFPMPAVLKLFDGGPAPFDQVLVVQQNTFGNACNGGPIWFLGLTRDGRQIASQHIAFCGGHDPVIRAEPDSIVVHVPGGPPNRGDGYIPSETWIFDGSSVRRVNEQKP